MLTLFDIMNRFEALPVKETRSVGNDYCEVVFFNEDIDKWNAALTEMLGPPVKPPGMEPDEKSLKLTQDTGGIWKDQTLFEKTADKRTVIAKFWPWQDGTHTTLKMAILFH